jgi:hypothetical protein
MSATKAEIIKRTLMAMSHRQGESSGASESGEPHEYDQVVIAELNRKLPGGEIKTCENFAHFGVSCCETCHEFYPHYDMYVEALPDGSHAWICDSVRSLLGIEEPSSETQDIVEVLDALMGRHEKRGNT